ncbi:MAG: hypothetical protein M1827_006390 [Pycnora praestabilis]|nr:MAG: hypothetical protein M1827_006390 [Pycnora praestabilis]
MDDKGSVTIDGPPSPQSEGYILDADAAPDIGAKKLASDGRTVLIPQPSDSPLDPLNWSWQKKHLILLIISLTSLLPDYGSATGAVTLLPQAPYWKISESTVGHSLAGNVSMLGLGGIIVVALSAYFGRLPVLFWFMLPALATAAWSAGAPTFKSFMAARILNAFFETVGQAGGLMFIEDMFFFHEHARKINFWSSFLVVAPYLGPMLAAFMISTLSWRWPFWIYTIMTGLCLLLICLFFDETYYDRRISTDQQPLRKSRWLRLVGLEQWQSRLQRNTFSQAVMRPVKAIMKLPVLIVTFYYTVVFAWAVGINNALSIFLTELYHFTPRSIGFYYFTPIVAVALGLIVGLRLHDFVANSYIKRHSGLLEPEARLLVLWISAPLQAAGLILIGFCFQDGYHYMVTAVAWGLYLFGVMISTVGLNAYVLDAYPEGSGEVAAWLNFARALGGFVVSYFEVPWATAMGTKKSFGIQAAISLICFGLIVGLQIWGKRLRTWSGRLEFKTG